MRSIVSLKKILIILIFLGAFLRFYKLAEFPIHLNHDEITQLYDAISIAQTGKDIYGNFLPFIFPSVGDFKPPFYTYITSLFYFIFGWSELTIRLPGAIFGVLIIPAIYFFVLKFLNHERTSSRNESIALIAAFFTAVAPFEIYFSRKSFENGAGILLMLIGFLCLFNFFANKQMRSLYFSSIIFAGGMYTYFSHAIIIPLLISIFIFIYRDQFSAKIRRYLLPILFFVALISPLIFMIFTNPSVRYRSQTVFISQDVALGSQLELGKSSNPLANFLLQGSVTIGYIFDRYLRQFDPIYLFANGLDLTNQGLMGLGPLLLVQLPFLILGIIFLIRNENLQKGKKFIAAWILLGMLPSGLTFESHSPHRVSMVFTMLNIISAIGLYYFLRLVRSFRYYFYLLGVLFVVLVLNFIYFLHIYFVNFPFEKSHYLQYPFEEVVKFAWSQYDNFEEIVFDPQFGEIAPQISVGAHYYLAFYGHVSPEKFQREYRIGNKPREIIFDKFSIRQVYWPEDRNLKNTLVVVSPWSVPIDEVDKNLIIQRFNFYNGKLAFYAIKL